MGGFQRAHQDGVGNPFSGHHDVERLASTSGNTSAGGNVIAADIKEARRLITAQLERSRKVFGIVWQALPEELRAQSAHISQGHAYDYGSGLP